MNYIRKTFKDNKHKNCCHEIEFCHVIKLLGDEFWGQQKSMLSFATT